MTVARPAAPIAPVQPAADAADLAGYHVTVVPHTHWDREWYQPFEVFRIRLTRAVERICDVLEADPRFRSFTLDGQAVILEDVLELRPDLEPRIRRLLAEGRLVTGPSSILPDEFLAGQEALVRNLLLGRAVCERYGAPPMAVGYLPDTFGHVAQLPQILRGFGLDTFVFWRGLGDEADRVGMAFTWEAPDGSQVLAIRQLGSYGNANQLGRWDEGGIDLVDRPDRYPEAAARRLPRFVRTYAAELARTPARELLLCNGSDHEEIHERLPDLLEHVRGAYPDTGIEIGSYEQYVARLRPKLEGIELPVIPGELVGGRDAPVLRGINSARVTLKQQAEATERALLVAETMAALAILHPGGAAAPAPLAELRLAWREHVRNLPHDSISGCSVDGVHRDMVQRFVSARRIAERIAFEGASALAGTVAGWSPDRPPTQSLSVVNPLATRRTVVVEIPVPPELAKSPLAAASGAGVVPVQHARRASPDAPASVLVALELDGFGARDIRLAARAAKAADDRDAGVRAPAADTITNGILTVRASGDGSVEVTDERTGRTYAGLHRFEDVADRGDEYNFCHLDGDLPVGVTHPGRVRVAAGGPVVAELEVDLDLALPRRLSDDRRRRVGRVDLPVRTRIRLFAGADRVEFTTTLDNRARDHRLRVRFAAAGATDRTPVRAEGHFGVVRRPARPVWRGSGWTEPPALTAHTAGTVAAGDVAILGRGLPEYEAVPTGDGLDLALTLLRCVGWLSRDDLATRPGHAGPGVPTPEAQMPGQATFEYALRVGVAAESDTALLRASADYRTPVVLGPAGAEGGPALRVEGEVVVSALKLAEDGRGAILRAFDPGPDPATVQVTGPVRVSTVRLDETDLDEDPAAPVGAGAIRSLRLLPDEPEA
ncbi:MAG TPA: glycoside hydrolase family 38 C-terminal domain-containing protein [Clostridia bacterium]|nr:glycoside hydrolase family 38 C-terminal domain-containing protein [Clostridia bacterium]